MPVGDILPELALVLVAIVVLLTASFTPRSLQWIGAPLALLGLAVAAWFCAQQVGEARLTFSSVWVLDGAGVWARLMILATTAVAVLIAPDWLRTDPRHGEYYSVLLFSTVGAMVLAGAADLLQLTLGVLLSSATGYTLAAYHRNWPLSLEAGMKYFLVGALANAMLVIGVALVFGLLGSSALVALGAAAAAQAGSPLLLLGAALVVAGLAFKMGAVPAHAWVPDVAEGAPAPSAAFLTVAPKIGAVIALARFVEALPPEAVALRPLAAVLAVATMTLGNLAALWQDDVRRLIGWSSVSQAGYALMAVCVLGSAGSALPALLVFLVGYAAATLAAFAVVAHLRGRTGRRDYAGLSAARPWAALTLTVSFLSLVGIPPLAGFVGKLALFRATIDGGYAWLAAVAVANTVVSLFYYLRVIGPMYFGEAGARAAVLGRWPAFALAFGLAAVTGFGVGGQLTVGAFGAASLLP